MKLSTVLSKDPQLWFRALSSRLALICNGKFCRRECGIVVLRKHHVSDLQWPRCQLPRLQQQQQQQQRMLLSITAQFEALAGVKSRPSFGTDQTQPRPDAARSVSAREVPKRCSACPLLRA
uniref:Uncharacterized protein n=1 Tax=Physcomitrium patens TaxID=3218 RepID=A0A2K1IF35_PHYPA|nr:hypothetical protein PHYPA_028479 [Physcomitrium patens]